METDSLSRHIYAIGDRLTSCALACRGIRLETRLGIIPRALVLENGDRSGSRGAVALGINPGQGDDEEQKYYLQQGVSYDTVLAFWTERRRASHQYHTRTRRFIDAIGMSGPILWTELVKCQNPPGVKALPALSTVRTCVHLYLVSEMSKVPPDWPIIAIGKKPYEIAAMMFPSRTVIGIPHPTGSYGRLFPALFAESGALQDLVLTKVKGALGSDIPSALWLGEAKT